MTVIEWEFWAGNAGTGTQPVNLTGTAITGSPPTSGPAQLSGSVGCAANDAACCEDQYPAYHGQTPEQATTAADNLVKPVACLSITFMATQKPWTQWVTSLSIQVNGLPTGLMGIRLNLQIPAVKLLLVTGSPWATACGTMFRMAVSHRLPISIPNKATTWNTAVAQ